MDEKRVGEILKQYENGKLDIGEAGIELLAAGVPAEDIIPMLKKIRNGNDEEE